MLRWVQAMGRLELEQRFQAQIRMQALRQKFGGTAESETPAAGPISSKRLIRQETRVASSPKEAAAPAPQQPQPQQLLPPHKQQYLPSPIQALQQTAQPTQEASPLPDAKPATPPRPDPSAKQDDECGDVSSSDFDATAGASDRSAAEAPLVAAGA